MAVNRAQLLSGNANQGTTLGGQVQAVKQGAGLRVEADGTIRFDFSTAPGVLLLNNTSAFNGYIWPNVQGFEEQFLGLGPNNSLSWKVPKGLVTLGNAPSNPSLGEQWFSYSSSLISVYQNKGGSASWQPEFQGLDPVPANCSSSPAFLSGSGTETSPYILEPKDSADGKVIILEHLIQVSGLAPYQYVPLNDLNYEQNGSRFEFTNFYADGEGVLKFKIKFSDSPRSFEGDSYTLSLSMGYNQPVYLLAEVNIVNDLFISSPGFITGTPSVGYMLTYEPGSASGGVPPYSYSWEWVTESGREVLQTNGNTYVLSPDAIGDRVYVNLIAEDSQSNVAEGSTSAFPAPPNTIAKGPFPNTNILFPDTIPGVASTTWLDAGTILRSNGCIEFATDGLTFSQGPTAINNLDTITTRWINSSPCGGANNGVTIQGCVYSDSYEECSSLTIDRIPSPFFFTSITEAAPGVTYQSNLVGPEGFNSTAYLTRDGISTGLNIQASLDNGLTWANVPLVGSTSFPVNPGQSFLIRLTTGPAAGGVYNAIINLGSGSSYQSAPFAVTNTNITTFSTLIAFPNTTTQEIASPAWSASDGSTSLSATGCIEFKVGVSGSWKKPGDTAEPISAGDILYTRWSNENPLVCGNAVHGTVISGTITNVPNGGTKTNTGSLTVDRVPLSFSFTNLTNQNTSTLVTSNIVNISGINAPSFITLGGSSTLTSVEANVNGSGWVSIPSSGESLSIPPVPSGAGSTLQIRGLTGGSTNSSYTTVVRIGQNTSLATSTWTVSTIVVTPEIATPSIVSPVNGSTGINPTTVSPAGVTISASAYTAINGAGSHTSSNWEVYYFPSGSGIPTYIVQTGDDTVNLQSYFVPLSALAPNITYYARVRYKSSSPTSVTSNWSLASQFKTVSSFSLQFTLREPGFAWLGAFAAATSSSSGYTVLVGDPRAGKIFRTLDGVSYSLSSGGVPNTNGPVQTGLAYGNGKFISVGSAFPSANSEFCISTNEGVNWSSTSYSGISDITSIAYSPLLDLFCIVGLSGAIYTSPGGMINWTQRSSGTSQNLQSVIWDGTSFRACGGTALLRSTNGSTWAGITVPNAPDGSGLGKIAYNAQTNKYLIARCFEGFPYDLSGAGGSIYIESSNDGLNWTQSTAPIPVTNICGGGDWYVATPFGGSSVLLTSNDAINWVYTPATNSGASYQFRGQALHYLPSNSKFIVALATWAVSSN